jgi:hypothetical protein
MILKRDELIIPLAIFIKALSPECSYRRAAAIAAAVS